jgi:ATPase subunit of ABC transporter with duplicated ATPase domains
LNSCKGSVLVGSHDRDFLEELNYSRMLRLLPDGLGEVEPLETFVGDIDDSVPDVVSRCYSS